MSKTKFVFDETTGTLKPETEVAKQAAAPAQETEENAEETVNIDLNTVKPNIDLGEPLIQFRQNSDYTIFQVTEERSKATMMVIAGYGLEIKFNAAELRSTERIEQLLEALTRMFRKMVLEQVISKS